MELGRPVRGREGKGREEKGGGESINLRNSLDEYNFINETSVKKFVHAAALVGEEAA